MVIDSAGPLTGELPRVSLDDTGGPPRPRRFRPLRLSLKAAAGVLVVWFFVLPLIPGLRQAASDLRTVNPWLLALGLVLQLSALFCYSLLTRAALGDSGRSISRLRLFRIQLSTKALSNIVPGGSAAGSALGYRLMTLSGVGTGSHAKLQEIGNLDRCMSIDRFCRRGIALKCPNTKLPSTISPNFSAATSSRSVSGIQRSNRSRILDRCARRSPTSSRKLPTKINLSLEEKRGPSSLRPLPRCLRCT